MEIFDVKPIPIHGGSMRYYVRKKGERKDMEVTGRVARLREREIESGYGRVETFATFGAEVATRKEKLMDLLERLRARGRNVAGYGASGRANTIIQYCGIDRSHIAYMIDDAPAKWGFSTPGSHLEIRSNEILTEDPPDYLLVFAWTYFKEIVAKSTGYLQSGGRMVTPLPDVHVLFQPSVDDDL